MNGLKNMGMNLFLLAEYCLVLGRLSRYQPESSAWTWKSLSHAFSRFIFLVFCIRLPWHSFRS